MIGPPPETWRVEPSVAGAREIVPGLWRLRLPLAWPSVDHVNAWAIERGDGGLLLVDCGSGGDPSCIAALEAALGQAGRQVGEVRELAFTHAHSDHVGLAAYVKERSDAVTWSHPADVHYFDVIREPERFERARGRRARREGVPEERLAAYATTSEELEGTLAAVRADRALVEGTRIDSALGSWEAIETPGHAPSHVCLLQRERGLLIAGDLVCVAFTPWMDYGFTDDPLAETLRSLDRIERLGEVRLALPGHGRPLEDLPRAVAEHREGFAKRLEAVRDALGDRALGGYELTSELWGQESDIDAVGHLTETLAYLRHLRRRGEVVRETSGQDMYRYRAAGPGEQRARGASTPQ